MRSFALFTLAVALGSAACNEEQTVMASATETTTSAINMEATSDTPTTGSATTGEPDTTTGTTTGVPPATTGSVPDPTTGAPPDDTSTSTSTTTGEPETSGTTAPAVPDAEPYEACSSGDGPDCDGDAICVDAGNTNGQVGGSYCAPSCNGMVNDCEKPDGAGPNVNAICAFDTNADMQADICALICNMNNDDCGNGSVCEDIGIPEMMVMGVAMKFGVCTHS